MANNFALNDAAMASPRLCLAAISRTLPLPQIAGEGVPVCGSPVAIADPRSRTPARTGELALSQSQLARVSRQLWPDVVVGADEITTQQSDRGVIRGSMWSADTHSEGLQEEQEDLFDPSE